MAYTGTHDNNTLLGCGTHASQQERTAPFCRFQIWYDEDPLDAIMAATLKSDADTAILPMQDLLHLPEDARMNLPGTIGTNWLWRMKPGALSKKLAAKLRAMNEAGGRVPPAGGVSHA